jgi:hypothetical protein
LFLKENGVNDKFGFGIHPDCHYYNDRITFKVITAPAVPEPNTLMLAAAPALFVVSLYG